MITKEKLERKVALLNHENRNSQSTCDFILNLNDAYYSLYYDSTFLVTDLSEDVIYGVLVAFQNISSRNKVNFDGEVK